jgi:hypothetical protein
MADDQTMTIPVTLRWVEHSWGGRSLMAGGVEMAYMGCDAHECRGHWSYTLHHTHENSLHKWPGLGRDEVQAMCEAHARAVLA